MAHNPEEINDRIDRLVCTEVSEDYDAFGFSKDALKKLAPFGMFLYDKWFRVEINGIENVPDSGTAIIVPNHSGQIPLDGAMIAIGCLLEKDPPRLPRGMIEKWFPTLPGLSKVFTNCGQIVGVTENAERLLGQGELMMIFPEGIRGSGKTWDKRYQLQRFATGFAELSIKFRAPIIPTAVIGGEEQAPAFVNLDKIAKSLAMPYFPLTPTFPWLGLLGFVPYPSRYHIYFGEPMDFSDRQDALDDPDAIGAIVEQIKNRVQEMVNEGLQKRSFPGF